MALSHDLTNLIEFKLDQKALDRIEWRSFGKGVQLGKLARAGAASLVLYRVEEGAPPDAFARHRHPGGEAYLVLEGAISDATGTYGKGTLVWLEPGTQHTPRATGKTVVLVLWPGGVDLHG